MINYTVLGGMTDFSVTIRIVDETTGLPELGVVFNTSGIDLKYRRELAANVSITAATLAALTTAHTDGGFLHIGNGYYRLDLPDAAVAAGVKGCMVHGIVTGMVVIGCYVEIVGYDPTAALATPTNITAGTVTTATNVTTVNGLAANVITAASIASDAITAAKIAADAITAAKLAADVATEIQSGLATSAALATVDGIVDDILVDTAVIGALGAGLTGIPWNAAWDAEAQSEATDALNAYDPPTRAEATTDANSILTAVDGVPTNAELATAFGTADDAILAVLGSPAGASVSADIAAVKVDTAATLVDTGTTLDGRIPAALTAGGNIKSDVLAVSGDTVAADRLEALMDGIIVAQVNDAAATTTAFIADGFTEATNDHFNGRLITFLTGALAGQQTAITDYTGATQTITVTALTEAPAENDFFVIH